MIEKLTHDLASSAEEIIREVESLGGMAKAIASGMPKLRIEESATRKQVLFVYFVCCFFFFCPSISTSSSSSFLKARIDSKQETIVGINKYRLEKEDQIDVLTIDNTKVREKQIERLKIIRQTRDQAAVDEILNRINQSAQLTDSTSNGDNPNNLLALAVEAAKRRFFLLFSFSLSLFLLFSFLLFSFFFSSFHFITMNSCIDLVPFFSPPLLEFKTP